MGTSAAGSDLHSEKIAKLQARKKELEILLAAKNEELYKLCVQEVKLTGVIPPEAPVNPPTDLIESSQKENDRTRKPRHPSKQVSLEKTKDCDTVLRKQTSHRLSTPSIAGLSGKSGIRNRGDFTSSYSLDNPPDTFSIHSGQVHPGFQQTLERNVIREHRRPYMPGDTAPVTYSRHHTLTTEHINKLSYNHPETRNLSRSHETHFSSSHPDITTQYTHMLLSDEPSPIVNNNNVNNVPLIYQYASQLKAQSHHFAGLPQIPPPIIRKKNDPVRRNTLQRTQTYHLTSHSDYNNHNLDNVSCSSQQIINMHKYSPLAESHISLPNMRKHHSEQFSPLANQNYQYSQISLIPQSTSSYQIFNNTANSINANFSHDTPDQKVKEKEWYESSLDSPSNPSVGMNLSRDSYGSLKKTLQQSPSLPMPQTLQDLNANNENISPLSSSVSQNAMHSRSQPNTNDVPFESPKNCTVVESGKWIPYREVSKPFEMSDFYKYSTKFRQNKKVPSTNFVTASIPVQTDIDQHSQEHWKQSQLSNIN